MAILWWGTIHGTRAMSMLLLGRGWSLSSSRRRFFPSLFFVIRFYPWNFGDTEYGGSIMADLFYLEIGIG